MNLCCGVGKGQEFLFTRAQALGPWHESENAVVVFFGVFQRREIANERSWELASLTGLCSSLLASTAIAVRFCTDTLKHNGSQSVPLKIVKLCAEFIADVLLPWI